MSESTAALRTLPLDKAAPVLAMHVSQVQARMARTAWQTGLAMAVPIILLWLAVEMPLDWHFELPRWARILFFLGGFGGAGFVAWKFGIRQWLRRAGDDEVALAIERALPELRSRFIASVQLSRIPEEHSRPLVRALVKETTERTRGLEFTHVVRRDELWRWVKVSAIAAALGCTLWWFGGNASWPLLKRAFLANIPKPCDTEIVAFTGDQIMALGEDLFLEIQTDGVIPPSGVLHLQALRGEVQQIPLTADQDKRGRFFRAVHSVQESFTYWIEVGDNRTKQSNVHVRPRPHIAHLALEQHWPAYTGMPPQSRLPGDLKIFAGSKLSVRLRSNVVLRDARAHFIAADGAIHKSVPLRNEAGLAWTGLIEIMPGAGTGITFHLTDEAGVESKGLAVYRLEIIPDKPPELAVLWPLRREELVTARATLAVSFEAKDDFAVERIKLHYGVNWTAGSAHKTVEFELPEKETKSLTRRFEWNLGRFNPALREGDLVDYWFEVADNNNVTGPGVTTLPHHQQARVVAEEEKRAELAARLADTLQGLSPVHQGQEQLAQELGEIIYEKKPAR